VTYPVLNPHSAECVSGGIAPNPLWVWLLRTHEGVNANGGGTANPRGL